jgi:hypothetical protein
MARPRPHSPYLSTTDTAMGFSSIAPAFWKTAEKIKSEAVQETAEQDWKAHWTIPSAICLYHAALDCFINEEIAAALAASNSDASAAQNGRAIQDMSLSKKKLEEFFSFFGLDRKQAQDVWSRTLLFIALRNRLYHHSPETRDVREYPNEVIDALNDAGIEPVNTSWMGQCTNVRLGEWASIAVRGFIDDWCTAGGIPSRMQLPGWEFEGSSGDAVNGEAKP